MDNGRGPGQDLMGLAVDASGPSPGAGAIGAVKMETLGGAMAVARARPRDLAKFEAGLLEEAKHAGRRFYYMWSTKNRDGSRGTVRGASIGLTTAAARHYGNMAIGCSIANQDAEAFYLAGTVVDLEAGVIWERPYRQQKPEGWQSEKMGEQRALDIALAVGASKCTRNVLAAEALPRWAIDKALVAAMEAEAQQHTQDGSPKGRAKPEAVKAVLDALERFQVNKEAAQRRVRKVPGRWTGEDVATLWGVVSALDDGMTTVTWEFPQEAPALDPDQLRAAGAGAGLGTATNPTGATTKDNEAPALRSAAVALAQAAKLTKREVKAACEEAKADVDALTPDSANRLFAVFSRMAAEKASQGSGRVPGAEQGATGQQDTSTGLSGGDASPGSGDPDGGQQT